MKHMTDAELRQLIRDRVAEREKHHVERRRREGKTVQGWAAAVKVPFSYIPTKGQELFGAPPISSGTEEQKAAAKARRRIFVEAYRAAFAKYCAGDSEVVFPYGTWLMRKRFGVRCHPAPPS